MSYPKPGERLCQGCGADLLESRGRGWVHGGTRYCRKCSNDRVQARQKAALQARRLLPLAVDRYGSDCRVCGEPVDLSIEWTRPINPDFPVAHYLLHPLDGGWVTPENIRAVHWRCSHRRRAVIA